MSTALRAEEKARLAGHSPSDANTRKIGTVGVSKPPDGGYGWIIVAASFMLNFVVDGIIYTVGQLLVRAWVVEFQVSETAASLTMSILTGCYYLIGPLASVLCNVLGCRNIVIVGALISSGGFLLSMYAPNIYALYLTFGFIGGVGFGFIYLPAIVVISQYFNKKRSLATGISVCGSGIGTTVFAMVNNPVYMCLDGAWRPFMVYLAAVTIGAVPISLLIRKRATTEEQELTLEKVEDDKQKTELVHHVENGSGDSAVPVVRLTDETQILQNGTSTEVEALLNAVTEDDVNRPLARLDVFYNQSIDNPRMRSRANSIANDPNAEAVEIITVTLDPQGKKVEKSICAEIREALGNLLDKDLLGSSAYLVLAISGLLTTVCFYVPFIYLGVHLERVPNLTTTEKNIPLSLIGVFNIIARLLCGYVSDLPGISPLVVSYFAISAAGVAMMLVPLMDQYYQFILFCIPFAAGVACFAALRSVICLELVGLRRHSNGFGILLMFMGIGALVGSPIAAQIKDLTGNFDASFYVMGALMVFSALMLIPLDKIRQYEERKASLRALGGAEHSLEEIVPQEPTSSSEE